MHAAGSGDAACVRLLVEGGAKVDELDQYGCTALTHAATRLDDDDDACVRALIAAGADVDKEQEDGLCGQGRTALMHAAHNGKEASVRALIAAGADVDKVDKDGGTALMMAACRGNEPCARDLIAAGALVDMEDFSGTTALIHLREIENGTLSVFPQNGGDGDHNTFT